MIKTKNQLAALIAIEGKPEINADTMSEITSSLIKVVKESFVTKWLNTIKKSLGMPSLDEGIEDKNTIDRLLLVNQFLTVSEIKPTKEKEEILKTDAVVGCFAVASGENRASKAIIVLLNSLINYKKSFGNSKEIQLHISSGIIKMTLDDISEIYDYIQEKMGKKVDIIVTVSEEENWAKHWRLH